MHWIQLNYFRLFDWKSTSFLIMTIWNYIYWVVVNSPEFIFLACVCLKYRWNKCFDMFIMSHSLLKIVVKKNITWIIILTIRYDKVVLMINWSSFILVIDSDDWLVPIRELKDISFWPMFDSQYQQQVLPYELILFDYRENRQESKWEREREGER